MRNNPFLSPNWVGVYLVAVSLTLLYFLEPLIKERTRSFEVTTPAPNHQNFIPINQALKVISSGKMKGVTPGQSISLEEILKHEARISGKFIVNFWATWCDPCIEEIPSLGALADQLQFHPNKSLPLLLTISVDESAETVRKFEKTFDHGLPFLVLHDPGGNFSKQLGIFRFPETFLIDAKGKILQKWIGPQDWLSLEVLQFLRKSL